MKIQNLTYFFVFLFFFGLEKIGLGQTLQLDSLEYALRLSKDNDDIENIETAAGILAQLYEKQGNGTKALEMYKLYTQIKDSIENKKNLRSSLQKEARFKYEKQRFEDSTVTSKNFEIKNLVIETQRAEIRAKKIQQYYLFGGLILIMVFAGFIFNRFKVTQKQKHKIEDQKIDVEEQKKLAEEKQKEVLDSIKYAKRIQTALLPTEGYIDRKLAELYSKDGH